MEWDPQNRTWKNIRRAINTSSGIRLYFDNTGDFRLITKMLSNDEIAFTTFQLREGRNITVVIRGVNESFTEEEILDELQSKIPSVLRVNRMKGKGTIWPLAVVHLDAKALSRFTTSKQ